MALLNGIIYTFKAADFPIKFISSFFKIFLILPLHGYQVRIAQQVSRGNESGLPSGACGEELSLGLGAFILQLPLYYIITTYVNNAPGTKQLASFDFSPGDFEGVIGQAILSIAVGMFVFGIPSFVIYLRWITTGNYLAAFNLNATLEYIKENTLRVVSGYFQFQAAMLLLPIILIVGGVLMTQTFLAICGILLLLPLPYLVQGYVVGKVAQETKVRAINPERDIYEDIDE